MRIYVFIILVAFLINVFGPIPTKAEEFILPRPGVMVHLSPSFNPPVLKGIKVHPDNPFRFDFILDKGDMPSSLPSNEVLNVKATQVNKQDDDQELRTEATKLIKYFLASLTIPEKDLWVNLSPYEKDRIVPESFGQTEMGRDLLAEDYMLKQITASLIYPEEEIGKKFWKRIYEESAKKFGTTNIPVNTFNKVWIVPSKAVVYENAKAGTAYVVESKLKVMLEQDYLAISKNSPSLTIPPLIPRTPISRHMREGNNRLDSPPLAGGARGAGINSLGSQIVREVVIPQLTKEINEGKNFSQLRQVYNSLILATWYKKKFKDSLLAQVYENKDKIIGININDPMGRQKIYARYLEAFKKGAYNYIKEGLDPVTQQPVARKYFSGGVSFYGHLSLAVIVSAPPSLSPRRAVVVEAGMFPSEYRVRTLDHAMNSTDEIQNSVFVNSAVPVRYFLLGRYLLRPTLVRSGQNPKGFIYAKEEMEEGHTKFNMWLLYSPTELRYGLMKDKLNLATLLNINLIKDIHNTWLINVFYPNGQGIAKPGVATTVLSYLVHIARLAGVKLQSAEDATFQSLRFAIKEGMKGLGWPQQILVDGSAVFKGWQSLRSPEVRDRFFDYQNVGKIIIRSPKNNVSLDLEAVGTGHYKIINAVNNQGEKVLGLIGKLIKVSLLDFDAVLDGKSIGQVHYIVKTLHLRGEVSQVGDGAMVARNRIDLNELGGIDLSSNRALLVLNNGQGVKFHIDPAQLQKLKNFPGFAPAIINIQPMNNLRAFLGLEAGIKFLD
jgi:hypothetical protein